MSDTERTYDLLDILRVIKGVWRWALLVPVLAACVVGAWAYFGNQTAGLPLRAQTVLRFPAAAFLTDAAERLARSITPKPSSNEAAIVVATEELPSQFAPTYRTVRLIVDTAADIDGQALLETAVLRFEQVVQTFDTQNQLEALEIAAQRDLLTGYLTALDDQTSSDPSSDDTTAKANSAASLVSALTDLNAQMQQVRERGSGPVVVVSPIEGQSVGSGMRWLRFPIVAAVGGLLAVLFVAFTQDGIRLAAARRRRHS